jgi:hypothetical protein
MEARGLSSILDMIRWMVSVAIIVVGVLALSALLLWVLLRGGTAADRARRDPRCHRRLMLFFAGICVLGAVNCAWAVALREPPQQILSAAGMELGIVLLFFHLLRMLKTPPVEI